MGQSSESFVSLSLTCLSLDTLAQDPTSSMISLIVFFFLVASTLGESFKTACFNSKTDHAVSNARPIAELFRVSVSDCLNYCLYNAPRIGDGCASLVYHRQFSTCQLYGHDGAFEGSVVVPVTGHDFYKRINFVGICQDSVVPKRGYKQEPKTYGVATKRMEKLDELAGMAKMPEPREELTTPPAGSKLNSEEVMDPRVHVILPPEFGQEEEDEPEVDQSVPRIRFLNPTHSDSCNRQEKVGYFVIFGYKLTEASKPSRLKGIDQSSCIMYCSQNINKMGEKVPCISVNYDPINEKCNLYDRPFNQAREAAILAKDTNIIFADKFCLKTKKDCSAESPFIVYPGKQMHKKIITSYPGMNSVVACIAACIDNGRCKAVTYKVGLCILHAGTPAADSSLLVDGNEETMVVENGCQLTAEAVPSMISSLMPTSEKQDNNPPWEEWSECQFGVNGKKVRVRQRECDDCEDLEVREC